MLAGPGPQPEKEAFAGGNLSGHPIHLNAGNHGPFTLDGTRSYLVGRSRVAIVDPGPDVEDHVRALASAVREAESVTVLLTHGHEDHAGSTGALVDAVGATVAGPEGLPLVDSVLTDGASVSTDAGSLVAVHTPGHTPDHLCFLWQERKALFAGDLLLGEGDTTWVAEYPGCVADYLGSLERLRGLDLDVIYPAHGPPLESPTDALDRFERHRRHRIGQVEQALASNPQLDVDALLDLVYGDAVPTSMLGAAARSLGALVEHVRGTAR